MNFESDSTSTRPYLIRALFEWCVDQGLTPYLLVVVNEQVRVPKEFVKNGEIVLNISPEATGGLQLGNEWIEFKARFGGVAREIVVPVEQVVAIYAKENAQGMAFPRPNPSTNPKANVTSSAKSPDRLTDKSKAHDKASSGAPGLSVVSSVPSDPTSQVHESTWSKVLTQVGLKTGDQEALRPQEMKSGVESSLREMPTQSTESNDSNDSNDSSLPKPPGPAGSPGSHLKRIK